MLNGKVKIKHAKCSGDRMKFIYYKPTDDEINSWKMWTYFGYDHTKKVSTFTVDQTTHDDNRNWKKKQSHTSQT